MAERAFRFCKYSALGCFWKPLSCMMPGIKSEGNQRGLKFLCLRSCMLAFLVIDRQIVGSKVITQEISAHSNMSRRV